VMLPRSPSRAGSEGVVAGNGGAGRGGVEVPTRARSRAFFSLGWSRPTGRLAYCRMGGFG
jgi:hypothetical protein